MKSEKAFDAVRMKEEIQKRISKEFENIPEGVARKTQMQRVGKNPLLSKFVADSAKTQAK